MEITEQEKVKFDFSKGFEEAIFNPTPYERTEVFVILMGGELISRAAEFLVNEMSRVYKGYSNAIRLADSTELESDQMAKYLMTLIYHRVKKSTNSKPEPDYAIDAWNIQVPAFMFPILSAIGPVIDTANGRRYVPVVESNVDLLKRDKMEMISAVLQSLRQYNFSSEPGIPNGQGSLDLMSMSLDLNYSELPFPKRPNNSVYELAKLETTNALLDSTKPEDAEQVKQIIDAKRLVDGYNQEVRAIDNQTRIRSKFVVTRAENPTIFSLARPHPVNGFFAAFLGPVSNLVKTPRDLRVKFGNVLDYIGSVPRILQPRQ